MKRYIFFIPILILIIILFVVSIAYPQLQTHSDSLLIVAGENFWGNIASQIAGSNAHVISIISDPNQDPHQYDSTTSDARNISQANIILVSGLGYDMFMQKILSTTNGKTIINAGYIANRKEGDNPHIWYDLPLVEQIANTLKVDLQNQDPHNSIAYESNYAKFINSLQPIENLCEEIKTSYANAPVIATERVANDMLHNCGLKIIPNAFQKAIEEGNDPAVADVDYFQQILRMRQADVLVYNKQTVSQITQQMETLARQNHIPIVGVTETMPLQTDYQHWILQELSSVFYALQG